MSSKYKYKKSRDNWKKKTSQLGKTARYQRKEIARIKKDRDRYKKEAREAKKQHEKQLDSVCPKMSKFWI